MANAIPPRAFELLTLLCVGWLALVIAASVAFRLAKRRYLFRPHFHEILFAEKWVSGRSLRSLTSRLGSARHCLWVTVTPNELLVGPPFPFNLMFLPEFYGLEYRINGADIIRVEHRMPLFGPPRAVVTFRSSDAGDEEAFELTLRDLPRFLYVVEWLRRMRGSSPATVDPERHETADS